MRPFIGRKQELQLLENAYTSKNAFVMVNGRRRVGKTAHHAAVPKQLPALRQRKPIHINSPVNRL